MDLLTVDIKKLYIRFLFPVLFSAVVTSIYSFIDTIAVGQAVGPDGTAAMAIINPFYGFVTFLSLLLGLGGSILMSNAKGREQEAEGNSYFTLALLLVTILTALLWICLFLTKEKLFRFLGATDALFPTVMAYADVLVMFFPAFIYSPFISCFIRNDNRPELAMKAVLVGGALNIFGDWFLVFPMDMGMRGAAIATVLGTLAQLLILSSHFFSKHCSIRFVLPQQWSAMTYTILKTGLGASLLDFSNVILFTIMNRQILRYSNEAALSVFGVVITCSALLQSLYSGVGQAIQPIVSANFGARNDDRCRKTLHLSIGTASIMGIVFVSIGFLFPEQILRTFMNVTSEILEIGPYIIRQYFFIFLFMGINIVAAFYSQSVLKASASLLISLLRGFVISDIAVLLFPALIGERGLWIALPVSEALVCLITFCILLHKRKRDITISTKS